MASGSGGRGRRQEAARAAAEQARDAAAQEFFELDTAQRDARISLETVTAADDSPDAQRAAADFAQLSRWIDEVSAGYIRTLDTYDLDAPELAPHTVAHAREALTQVGGQMHDARGQLAAFTARLEPLLGRAASELARVVPAVERAKQALRDAAAALDGVRGAGLRADDAARRLAGLGPALTVLNEGAGRHGVRTVLATADDVVRQAEAIRAEVARLPERARELDRRLASLRTRVQAVETRAARLGPSLSELRRGYSEGCWADLHEVPQQAQAAVKEALGALDQAARDRQRQDWDAAAATLAGIRSLLQRADDAVDSVDERLRALREVAFDPRPELDRTRFAVRDAQRLAMTGRAVPDPRHAGPLDAAMERIDRAQRGVTDVPHPDWWHFLQELAAVRETAADVVRMIREDRATRP